MNLPGWFRSIYLSLEHRRAVSRQYAEMQHTPLVLADIGLRGGLWSAQPRVANLYEAGVAEGRRQMALELFKIVKADPDQIFSLIPTNPRGAKDERK